jgi:hypothetical protein
VFDGVVAGAGDANAGLSREETWNAVGQADKLFVQVVATQATGTSPTLTLVLAHSIDGIRWVDKATLINAQALSANAVNLFNVSDLGTAPNGRYVRFRVQLGGTNPVANVRVLVTGRTV